MLYINVDDNVILLLDFVLRMRKVNTNFNFDRKLALIILDPSLFSSGTECPEYEIGGKCFTCKAENTKFQAWLSNLYK